MLCPSEAKFVNRTRRERLKSASYLRLKKRKIFFLKLKFLNFFLKKSCIVPKNVKGGPKNVLTYISLQNIKKLEGGPFGDMKCRTVPQNIRIHMPQKWNLSSSVKCIFCKTRANRILVKKHRVHREL